MTKWLPILSVLLLVSCAEIDQQDELTDFIERSSYHEGSVWLEQEQTLFPGTWDPVILVFGWSDDRVECETIKTNYAGLYPAMNYRCNPAK